MKSRFDAYLFGDVTRARPVLLAKMLLAILGFDCLVDLVPHGGRYGVGGFNVAHFALLDALLPMPSPPLYVGALIVVATLALVLVFGRLRRGLLVLFTSVYTLAWASSLLDAYQHHYLVSLLLVSMCCFPFPDVTPVTETRDVPITATKKSSRAKARAEPPPEQPEYDDRTTSAPGYVSFFVTCAIVYVFAAIAKLDPDFRSGRTLARIVAPSHFDYLFAALARFGIDTDQSYALLSRGALAIELACAAVYLVAPTIDRGTARRRWLLGLLAFVPLAFHATVESLDLGIGWFSRYMIAIPIVAFAPREVVVATVSTMTRLGGAIAATSRERFTFGVLGLIALLVTQVVVANYDLPGAIASGVISSLVVAGVAAAEVRRRGFDGASDLPLALLASVLAGYFAIAHPRIAMRIGDGTYGLEASFVRYDYYRFVGGDARRRDAIAASIAAYEKARDHAPNDTLREQTELKLERLRRER